MKNDKLTEEMEREEINKAIDNFAEAMKEKMWIKRNQGFFGWEKIETAVAVRGAIIKARQIQAGDLRQVVDAANYLMMIHHKKAGN
jgi:sulfite reductase beta subunit-like hemoprotein